MTIEKSGTRVWSDKPRQIEGGQFQLQGPRRHNDGSTRRKDSHGTTSRGATFVVLLAKSPQCIDLPYQTDDFPGVDPWPTLCDEIPAK